MHRTGMLLMLGLLPLLLNGESVMNRPPSRALETTHADGNAPSEELIVFAAASLMNAFQEVGDRFHQLHADVHVTFNFAGSQQLARQIAQGAPLDVFASADSQQMAMAISSRRIAPGSPRGFAANRLVMVIPEENTSHIRSIRDLAMQGTKVVLAAPEVPAGWYTREFLRRASTPREFGADYEGSVLHNVVSEEQNVRAVLIKISLGEADAGIVYQSDVFPENAGVKTMRIPEELNVRALYLIATARDADHPVLAKLFVDYILSPLGQEVIAKYGFLPTSR